MSYVSDSKMKNKIHTALIFSVCCLALVLGTNYQDTKVPPTENLVYRINAHIFNNAPKPPSSTPMSRLNSISFIAMHDVINSIHKLYRPIYTTLEVKGRNKRANVRAAILGAFNTTRALGIRKLPNNYKADQLLFNDTDSAPYLSALETFVQTELSLINDTPENIQRGIALGVQAAHQTLAVRENDGYKVAAPIQDYPCGTVDQWCSWTETTKPVDARGAGYPNWGNVRPFSFSSASEYTVPPPPANGSFLFEASLNITKMFGQRGTPLAAPGFLNEVHTWSLGAGGEIGSRIVDSLIRTTNLQLSDYETVALFGRLYIGNCDALIVNLYNKFKYNAWRPRQAIQMFHDATWEPFLTTPLNQEYPCGHCQGTAGALYPVQIALGFDEFPNGTPVQLVMPNQRASPSFTSFSEVLDHVNRARLYGGMHFEFSIQTGSNYGQRIAKKVFETLFVKIQN